MGLGQHLTWQQIPERNAPPELVDRATVGDLEAEVLDDAHRAEKLLQELAPAVGVLHAVKPDANRGLHRPGLRSEGDVIRLAGQAGGRGRDSVVPGLG
jgi:hypothetical protein